RAGRGRRSPARPRPRGPVPYSTRRPPAHDGRPAARGGSESHSRNVRTPGQPQTRASGASANNSGGAGEGRLEDVPEDLVEVPDQPRVAHLEGEPLPDPVDRGG